MERAAAAAGDGVFQPGYEIESIEEHAELMWRRSHLPAIGPTPDGESVPLSLGKRHQAVLNELEKAHIYIERLHERLKEKDQRIGKLEQRHDEKDAEFARRLSRLEALLGAVPAD